MLIRWATQEDKRAWLALSQEYDKHIGELTDDLAMWYDGFDKYMDTKISKFNAVIAVNRMSGFCNGLIAFSKAHNRITFFAVSEKSSFDETASRLLTVALRQLDTRKEISIQLPLGICKIFRKTISAFEKSGFVVACDDIMAGVKAHNLVKPAMNEKRGGSFHYSYDKYAKMSQKKYCPPCNHLSMPEGQIDIAELDYSFAGIDREAQGRLFGKCHLTSKYHVVDFEEMPPEIMYGFMRDVQIAAKALHKVTGAIKINYEIHSNSAPHIHCHLFPRYLDDDFPSAPIDYRITEPSPYESEEEYIWFVESMRKELKG